MLAKNSNVAVIGAGISSLSFTYFLSKIRPDLNFTIYEKSNHIGGYIKSELYQFNGENIRFEKGPRTLRAANDGTSIMCDILIQLGLDDKIRVINKNSIANKKYLLSSNNKLIEVPSNSIKSIWNFVKSELGKGLFLNIIKEPFQPSKLIKDESVQSFLSRRFSNNSIGNNIVSAIYHGIYAADINKLSIRTTMPKLVKFEQDYGSIIKGIWKSKPEKKKKSIILQKYNELFEPNYDIFQMNKFLQKFPMILFENGLSTFTNGIYKELLSNPKISIKLNKHVEKIEINRNKDKIIINDKDSFDHLRSTINVNDLIKTFKSSPRLNSLGGNLTYVDIFLANIYLPKSFIKQNGFGFLVPLSNSNEENLLGVIYDSDIEKSSIQLFKNNQLDFDSKRNLKSIYNPQEYTKLTMMFGGHMFKSKIPNQDQLLLNLNKSLRKTLGIDLSIENHLISSSYISQCLPQFNVGYNELSQNFQTELNNEFNGLISHGGMSFGNGAGVPDCVVNAFESALKLK
ncbi:hypothetical protein WICMUC_000068 [Wickerhamomyces mucosus]|uniref:Protoporphyrinogen oxidase n=1 Tax=Wickerhamomyces mucosus TaxID=1378264 RepID=A0A9P8Q0H7_9ASCO|nr:hypothetical protein WICMUC_000068 [Wickerhamomyces mucosus]